MSNTFLGSCLAVAACTGFVVLAGCGSRTGDEPQRSAVTSAGGEYQPVYGNRAATDTPGRGTVRGDFQWAALAPTTAEAIARWEEYLKTHNPPGREFEDNLHASYVTAAQYELMRAYYLAGRSVDGDAILRRLDPVGWLR